MLLRRAIVCSALAAGACSKGEDRPAASVDPHGGLGPDAGPDGGDASTATLGSIVSTAASNEWELETEVAIAPNGRDAFAIWMIGGLGYRYDVGYAVSKDGGDTWSAPHRVPAAPDIGVNACVTADRDGKFHVTWLEAPKSAQRRVMAATYVPASDVFTLPREVSDPAAPAANDKPWIVALDDASLLIAFGMDSGTGLVVAKSKDGGDTWSRSAVAQNGTLKNVVFPCASGAKVHVAYLIPSGVEMVTSNDSGATFGDPVRVDVPSGTAFEPPSCVAKGDDVWVAYGVGGGSGSTYEMALLDEVWVAHSVDNGKSLANRTRVSDASEGRHFLLPRLTAADTGLAIGYYAGASAGADGTFRVAFSDGVVWPTSRAIAAPRLQNMRGTFDSLGDYVGMHARTGGVLVAFADNTSVPGASVSHIRMAKLSR